MEDLAKRYAAHIPTKLKSSKTQDKRSIPFESVKAGQYKPGANCATFKTTKDRLLPWVTAIVSKYQEMQQVAGTR